VEIITGAELLSPPGDGFGLGLVLLAIKALPTIKPEAESADFFMNLRLFNDVISCVLLF
jgi:hypothetical protein